MQCRFIDSGPNDPYLNMAIDESLFACCDKPALRVFQWSPSSMSVGYSQSAVKEINMNECKKNRVPIVRRITGGKAVFHDQELTYSFIVPENTIEIPEEVTESYKMIADAILLAFRKIGVKAEIKKQPERFATPICFNSSNWYEMESNGKKICGSAQKRMNGKFLQHGSLLMDFDYEKNALLFNQGYNEVLKSLKKNVTSIKKELKRKISYEELGDALKYGFEKKFDMDFLNDALTKKEEKLAQSLKNEKYSRSEWNLRA